MKPWGLSSFRTQRECPSRWLLILVQYSHVKVKSKVPINKSYYTTANITQKWDLGIPHHCLDRALSTKRGGGGAEVRFFVAVFCGCDPMSQPQTTTPNPRGCACTARSEGHGDEFAIG